MLNMASILFLNVYNILNDFSTERSLFVGSILCSLEDSIMFLQKSLSKGFGSIVGIKVCSHFNAACPMVEDERELHKWYISNKR